MTKVIKVFTYIIAALLLFSACSGLPGPTVQGTPQGSASPSGIVSSPSPIATSATATNSAAAVTPAPAATAAADTDALKALLPDKVGFQWQYFGFAEYAMTLQLKSIGQSAGVLSYTAEGAVADMSGGKAKGDFKVKIIYKVAPGVMSRQLAGNKAMDSVYQDIELIRAPLKKGTQWVQAVRDSNNKETNLACTITDVKTLNGRKVYLVTYKAEGSDYYEKREITQGMGVTSFDKLYKYDTGSDLIGYRLYTLGYEQWLPKLGQVHTFFGLAEYGHKGKLVMAYGKDTGDVYEYSGVYADGTGKADKFVIRYYVDLVRGTVTEQVVSNERGKAEVNSKLHNLVILKFPLSLGEHWSHQAKLNGKTVTVQAVVTEYDEAKGVVKVRYMAKGAAGYYDNTYIEERTFEKGYGLTGFSNLIPGNIGISAEDAKDPKKLDEAIKQHSFGYSMNKTLVD